MAWKASGPRAEMERHGAPKSAGLAGVSSEVRLGDGWLVCSALLLEWSKLNLLRSIGRIFTSPKNTRPTPHHKHKHKHHDHQNHPISKRSPARFPPPVLLCLLAVGWAVGCWLDVVAAVAAVAAAAFGGACWQWSFFSGAGARKWCCCQCISATGVLVLGLMWCWCAALPPRISGPGSRPAWIAGG